MVKLERAKKHAEDKKSASQKTIERLQHEYDNMVVERRENDKQIEEVRQDANEVELKVHLPHVLISNFDNRLTFRCKNIRNGAMRSSMSCLLSIASFVIRQVTNCFT